MTSKPRFDVDTGRMVIAELGFDPVARCRDLGVGSGSNDVDGGGAVRDGDRPVGTQQDRRERWHLLCEDGSGDNLLRGLTPTGQNPRFARNADPAQARQEFAGATLSPDGKTLFVNIQSSSGYSIAIWGLWARAGFA